VQCQAHGKGRGPFLLRPAGPQLEATVNYRSFIFHQIRINVIPLLISVTLLLAGLSAHGQAVEKGVITGLVSDSSGSILRGIKVSLYNMATDITTETTTDNQGLFVSPPLDPGDYDIEIKADGFKRLHQNVRIEVGQRISSNITLPVGNSSETVEVQSNTVALQTESSSIENLRTEDAVKDLPLNGRSFAGLVGLGAGAVPAHTQIANIPYTQQRGDTSFAFNGLRFQENRLLLDGIGDNENHNGLAVVIFPPIDAIQEFSEETTDADARYGRGNGGTVNLVFKSGTAQYHGGVFEFLRNDALNSRNYFATAIKPPLRQNTYGGTFGGPLFFRQAHRKTFFFVDYNGEQLTQGQTDIDTVPYFKATTVNGIAGYDFSAYSQAIKNPQTKVAYANNFIPQSDPLINATGLNILNFYQKYAAANKAGATTANNFLYNPVKTVSENAFDVKIDHTFNEKDSAFGRYSHALDNIGQPGLLPVPLVGAIICGPAQNPAHQSVLSETHVFSSRLINTARVGWSRFFINAQNWDAGQNLPTTLGIPGVERANDPRADGLPVLSFSGGTSIGDAGNSPTQIGTNNYQTDDNINLILGKHSLDIGAEFIRLQYNMFQTGVEHGSESYGTSYTGLAWTDLLFGTPKSGTYSYPTGTVGLRQADLSFYMQDNYKVNSRLTLNAGLRYENFLGWPWTEVNNKEYNFVPSISTTSLIQVGTQGVPRSGANGNNLNFAPRVGFAYRVTSKTVFHSGYGIYYSAPNVTNSSGLSANVPVDDYWAFNNSATYGAATNGAAFNFSSNGFAHTQVTSASALPANLPVLAQDPNAKTPYSEQWHAAIEQQVPFSTVLKFAYVGTRGVHLDDLRDINAGSPGTTSVTTNRPYPFFAQINLLETEQVSSYNALQVTAERRAHNLGFLASYTYSHSLDENTGSPGSVTNPWNIRSDYGNSDLNIPSRFVASANYQLPFKAPGKLKYAVEGWQLNTILNYFDGLPFSVSAASGVGDGLTPRAALLPGYGNGSLPSNKRTLSAWFNTAAFTNPAAGTWGNSGRNILQGPGTKTVDFSFFKNTTILESKVLQLRAEFFNLFNTPQFNNPGSTAGTSAIGTISSAGSEPTFQRTERQIQLAAKINF
jgi:hypothetical protein